MHTGKNYSIREVLFWTRRDILRLVCISTIPTCCYVLLGWKWLAIPWLPVALLGTAVAFAVGFRNNASYDRMWEARKAWGAIVNVSRAWGMMVRDYISRRPGALNLSEEELESTKLKFIRMHFAWLTALRFQLREARVWESIYKKHNQEYQDRWFSVAEHNSNLEKELLAYLPADEVGTIMSATNKPTQVISMQSARLKEMQDKGLIEDLRHMELEKILLELLNQQGASERIKNFPYPRQYATVNMYFIYIFSILVPLAMLQEFEKMNMIWLSIPFSTLSTWIFSTMEKIGESTESPFEGSANDVPITAISRSIEIDLREMFNDTPVPSPIKSENNILI